MTRDKRPTLFMLAGPNGSGKSTLYETRIAPNLAIPFINADQIQMDELRDGDLNVSYEAARVAAERREEFLSERMSFATETVFSHPSKLDLIKRARKLGYRIMIFHICVDSPDLSVARVAERVKEGGHAVPEVKIRDRYDRNGPIIRQAVLLSDAALIFDNSLLNQPPRQVMSFLDGKVTFVVPQLPEWALKIYGADLLV